MWGEIFDVTRYLDKTQKELEELSAAAGLLFGRHGSTETILRNLAHQIAANNYRLRRLAENCRSMETKST